MAKIAVAPLVGARIEIRSSLFTDLMVQSLPSWERGLKSEAVDDMLYGNSVAPLVGARIEIICTREDIGKKVVAPLVGARIEIGRKKEH